MQELLKREDGFRRKVMVVDDELINREMLGTIVGRDYDVLYAENGERALELIRANKQTLSLVMLDLLMPEMDGYQLLEILREDAELSRIPVIVLTADKTAEVKSLQLGAADFIPKPYDMPEVIFARVRRSIELAENTVIIHETERDELTGLFNREYFFEFGRRLDCYHPDRVMDAIVLDVNRFHLVNELYGREYGDAVLKAIGDGIHETVRKTGGLACRSSSNCFYMYIPHRDDYETLLAENARIFAERMNDPKLTIRVGIYQGDGSCTDPEECVDCAILACSKLRNSYATAFCYYDNALHEREVHAERLINEMDRALSERQFQVYYQPKYNIRGEAPVLASAEALIRWKHPEFGMISPGEFIPLFEEHGLIQKLDRYVWREAAAQIADWKARFGVSVPVSVNVSRIDIFDPLLEGVLLDLIGEFGLEPQEFLLEITESAYTDDSQQIIDTVHRLRADGFRVEMDDFGSGYSSLNMLTALPIDALKLDMKFIRGICSDAKNARMVEIMIEIAEFLKVPVIAEGVETQEQVDLLKGMGCDIIQGYFFSRPVPAEQFEAMIRG